MDVSYLERIEMTHAQLRAHAEHYAESCEFMGLFDARTFDEEVNTDVCWMGFVRDEQGELQLHAEFIYDAAGSDSGKGWYK